MSLGLQTLNSTFGTCGRPRIGWQIDPFGHSKEQASILANMGYDGLFFGRLDWRDKTQREDTLAMEMVWQASEELAEASDLFTGVLFNSYSPPDDFCWDLLCNDAPLMDNPLLENNIEERIASFLAYVEHQAKYYKSNHIMLTMGMDFHYQAAHAWFMNLDKLISHVNQLQTNGSNVHVFYSTPSCYLKSLQESGLTWPTKTDDFFPYASDPHAYWSGYFTSRPASKRFIREAEIYSKLLSQLTVLRHDERHVVEELSKLRETVGIIQHHDAVTGTEKQHVAHDYHKRIHAALAQGLEALGLSLDSQTLNAGPIVGPLLNLSQCSATEALATGPVRLTLFNPLAWNRRQHAVRVPVAAGEYTVQRAESGEVVTSQLIPLPSWISELPGRLSNVTHELVFSVMDLAPLGTASFVLQETVKKNKNKTKAGNKKHNSSVNKLAINTKSSYIKVDPTTGALYILDKNNGKESVLQYELMYYPGHRGNNSEFEFRASGAYIFRPEQDDPVSLGDPLEVSQISGDVVDEIHVTYSVSWAHLIVRTYKEEADFIEMDWVVGPIPVDDGVGKEVIIRYSTEIQNDGVFFTDANGRQLMKRVRYYRPTYDINMTEPTAQNYYPVNAKIIIEDDNEQLAVLTDRSEGGASIVDGTVELMLHRRLLDDDAFGVNEALNEMAYGTGLVVRGRHRVFLTANKATAAVAQRAGALELFYEPLVVLNSPFQPPPLLSANSITLAGPLPPNLHLLTLELLYPAHDPFGDYILLRLEHIYQAGEHPDHSAPTELDLTTLFTGPILQYKRFFSTTLVCITFKHVGTLYTVYCSQLPDIKLALIKEWHLHQKP